MLLSKKSSYSQIQKDIASNINYKSIGTYTFLRDQLNLHLPSQRSLYNYNTLKKISPGFEPKIIQNLKEIFKELGRQLKTSLEIILIFDEITLRRELVLNSSSLDVDGFVDYGFQRTNEIGKHALVFLISGLHFEFQYPLNYFVCKNAMNSSLCKEILRENIVRATSSDQGSNFRGCTNLLKVSFE